MTRRDILRASLFGSTVLGLRALATGLPASFLANPRTALADPVCAATAKAQFVIFNTSGSGDPINTNCPGTYFGDPGVPQGLYHPPDASMAPTKLQLAGKPWTAAAPWAQLPQPVLDRTQFWHIMTNTPVHAAERAVLELNGGTMAKEILPSVLAASLAPCLGTLQPQPIALASTPLYYQGQALPLVPPFALKYLVGPLADGLNTPQLQALRDDTLNKIHGFYRTSATPAQQQFIDKMANTRGQWRSIQQGPLATLANIPNRYSADAQIQAAVALIQMKLAPVIAVDIPFGGDNHSDPGLATEVATTSDTTGVSGVGAIASLMQQLQAAGLADQVSFISLNVFGRTLATNGNTPISDGRDHNAYHQVSLAIGKPFRGGVIGGVGPAQVDFGAVPISSSTGVGSSGGDIQPIDTLGAFAQTMLAAFGIDPTVISNFPTAKPIASVLA
ncbi:MAG TPA: hypothetical protein VGH28_12565 [Polyangiaceae bacterium]